MIRGSLGDQEGFVRQKMIIQRKRPKQRIKEGMCNRFSRKSEVSAEWE